MDLICYVHAPFNIIHIDVLIPVFNKIFGEEPQPPLTGKGRRNQFHTAYLSILSIYISVVQHTVWGIRDLV
jgi:hypothetical protein